MLFFNKYYKVMRKLHSEKNARAILNKTICFLCKNPKYIKTFLSKYCDEMKPHLAISMSDDELILVMEAKVFGT